MFDNLTGGASLPSLNGLRAFEAMARNGSATKAAAELNVTHSAISRQVKALQATLGVRLFDGPRHRLTLTPTGQELAARLTEAFDVVASAVTRARGVGMDLHVAVNASLSVKWLIPRLPDFVRDHPEIGLHLSELAPHATHHRGADLVVRFLQGERARALNAVPIMASAIGPVIAPSLAGRDAACALQTAPRLLARTHTSAWDDWISQTGAERPTGPERAVAHLHFVLDGAVAGLGAAVLPWALAAEAVRAGQLIAPFGFIEDDSWLAAIPGQGETSRAARTFLRWLRAQGEAFPPAPTGGPEAETQSSAPI